MPIPQSPQKFSSPVVFTATERLALRRQAGRIKDFPPPAVCILSYQPGLVHRLKRGLRLKKMSGFTGDLYLVPSTGGRVAITANFGVGAPAAVVVLEELAAFGIPRFVSIGLAGGLDNSLKMGEMIICERALRDEGTSFHYLEPDIFAYPSQNLTTILCSIIASAGHAFSTGASWTTDAPYRETQYEVKQYARQGIKTVEMEAAALFAAAQALGVEMAAMFAVADVLETYQGSASGFRWKIKYSEAAVLSNLEQVALAIIQNYEIILAPT